jgi:hypothetical protein
VNPFQDASGRKYSACLMSCPWRNNQFEGKNHGEREILHRHPHNMRFVITTAATRKYPAIWDGMPCNLVDAHRYFEGTCWLHIQGRRLLPYGIAPKTALFMHAIGRARSHDCYDRKHYTVRHWKRYDERYFHKISCQLQWKRNLCKEEWKCRFEWNE